MDDLADFKAEWVDPVAVTYRGRTIHVPPPPGDEPGLAWSVDDDTDETSTNWRGRLVWAGLAALVVAIAAALVLLVSTLFGRHTTNNAQPQPVPSPPTSTPPPTRTSTPAAAPAQPVLNGVYQVVLNASAATYQGSLNLKGGLETKWFAFQPQCTSGGCVIHGVMLDDNNHTQADSDILTLNYVDDRWVEVPVPHSDLLPGCSEGTQQLELRPAQPDGTWVGTQTLIITSNCPDRGSYAKAPITATWTGPVPAGLLGTGG